MLIRIYDEVQTFDEPPRAVVGFQYNASDAPGTALYSSYGKRKLILALLKALWVVITRGQT